MEKEREERDKKWGPISLCCSTSTFTDELYLWDPVDPLIQLGYVDRCGKCLQPTSMLKMKNHGLPLDGEVLIRALNIQRCNTFTRQELGLPQKQQKVISRKEPEPPAETDIMEDVPF